MNANGLGAARLGANGRAMSTVNDRDKLRHVDFPLILRHRIDALFEQENECVKQEEATQLHPRVQLTALKRMAETDNIVALAQQLGLERKLLYCWRAKDEAARLGQPPPRRRPSTATAAERNQPA